MAVTSMVLLSGGHDSANLLRQAVADGHACHALFVDYGQPAATRELCAAISICDRFDVQLHRRTLPSLPSSGVQYLARNMVLIGHATALAASLGCEQVLIGCHGGDYARFPDCTPQFLKLMDAACHTAYGVRVKAPLRQRSSYIIPGTWSCYEGGAKPCGVCMSCRQTDQQAHVDQ